MKQSNETFQNLIEFFVTRVISVKAECFTLTDDTIQFMGINANTNISLLKGYINDYNQYNKTFYIKTKELPNNMLQYQKNIK